MAEPAQTVELIDLCTASAQIRDAMRDLRNLESVRQFIISQDVVTAQEHANWLASLEGNRKKQVFAVMLADRLVGQANLSLNDSESREAEWGFFVDPALRGRGIARNMLCALLAMAFDKMGLQKINASVLDHNVASLELHKRFGFTEEGRRSRHSNVNGAWRDLVLYGMTREEWLIAKTSLPITSLPRNSLQGNEA